jgi:hypothetical protein
MKVKLGPSGPDIVYNQAADNIFSIVIV